MDVEDGEESLARRQVGAVEDFGQDVGIETAQILGDELVLAVEVLVQRPLGDPGHRTELVNAGAVDALIGKQLLGRAEKALSSAPAAPQAARSLLQLRHSP
ncbi:hypothetical protein RGU41_09445 [Cryobacterium sp. 10C3]|nr:hypothetical protein [Cryobacterium sp. 10C3]MDY7556954.1 hypothetical protein [Cryobacterium sp. 10C3]